MGNFSFSRTATGFWRLATGCSDTEWNLDTGIGKPLRGNWRMEYNWNTFKASRELPAASCEHVQLKPAASCQLPASKMCS